MKEKIRLTDGRCPADLSITVKAWNKPQFAKLNRAAFLAMDPAAAADLMKVQVDARLRAPSELRALEDREPYTDEQLAEFDRLFGTKNPQPTPKGLPA